MKRVYSILILGLFYVCSSFGIASEFPHYTIIARSEIIPEFQDNKLNLCRMTKEMDSDVALLSPETGLETYTDLIHHLISDSDISIPLNVLVDNFIRVKFEPSANKDLLESNLPIVSALINITTTHTGDFIQRKLIKTYEAKTEPSEIYPIQLFKITDEHDVDITEMLAGRLTTFTLGRYVTSFRDKIPSHCISFEPKSSIIEYQSSITKLINQIVSIKNQIFKDPLYTQINYYIDFMVKYVNKIITEKSHQLLTIEGVRVLVYPTTPEEVFPLLTMQTSGFKSEDITHVQQLKREIEESQKSLDLLLLKPLKSLSQEEDKRNFAAYVQLLQLFITNPYR